MERTSRLLTALVVLGFTLAVGAWFFAVFGGDRSVAMPAFAGGFVIATIGACTRVILMPKSNGKSTRGYRIMAIGFAISAVPSVVGTFFLHMPENDTLPFFYIGAITMVVGIAIVGKTLTGDKR